MKRLRRVICRFFGHKTHPAPSVFTWRLCHRCRRSVRVGPGPLEHVKNPAVGIAADNRTRPVEEIETRMDMILWGQQAWLEEARRIVGAFANEAYRCGRPERVWEYGEDLWLLGILQRGLVDIAWEEGSGPLTRGLRRAK